ncbi:MAG: hypothetical protein IPO72_02590 [Saprospiraceae bacterium]|nr:hypothetical protein [Candidatus Vicinibacter affinis]
MSKILIKVKKNILNKSLIERDYDFLDFLEILDDFSINLDTLNNIFIFINYEYKVPVYLKALKILKAHTINKAIEGRAIPLQQYLEGYNQGLKIDISPGIENIEYIIENICLIFEPNIQPFHFDNSYGHSDYPGGPISFITGFSDSLWYEYGVQIGKEKQAWDIIMKNLDLFVNHLDKNRESKPDVNYGSNLYNTIIEIRRIISVDIPLSDELNSLNKNENSNVSKIQNNFDKISIMDVYNHFKIGLVDKKYLTDEELIKFLQLAFEQKAPPKNRFKIKNAKTKQIVISLFYKYYKNIAGRPHRKQKDYAALLGEYFEGYNTNNVSSNFNK